MHLGWYRGFHAWASLKLESCLGQKSLWAGEIACILVQPGFEPQHHIGGAMVYLLFFLSKWKNGPRWWDHTCIRSRLCIKKKKLGKLARISYLISQCLLCSKWYFTDSDTSSVHAIPVLSVINYDGHSVTYIIFHQNAIKSTANSQPPSHTFGSSQVILPFGCS